MELWKKNKTKINSDKIDKTKEKKLKGIENSKI